MIHINFRDARPIYEQVRDGFRQLILTGILPEDSKLPSVRELAGQLAINPNTIQRAYRELELEGYIVSVPGRGSFVRQGDTAALARRAELLVAGDLRVFDTAGFSLLALSGRMEPENLRLYYPEFAPYEGTCRFEPCLHDREPGCALTAAVREGAVPAARQARYRQLLAEVRETWEARYD